MTLYDLRTENQTRPLGLGEFRPRFSWKLAADGKAIVQKTRQIQVAANAGFSPVLWDSGVVADDKSHFVAYGGPALAPRTRYWFRVQVSATGGKTDWSAPEWFETALSPKVSAPGAWNVPFISPEGPADGKSSAAKALKRAFDLPFAPVSARLYATALGLYEMTVNGKKVTPAVLTPGWTAYQKRLAYQTYDVTPLLKKGANALGALLGPGWYKGELTWMRSRNLYGKRLALSALLEVTGPDGQSLTLTTDATWLAAGSPIVYSEIYHGEVYDARLEGAETWTPAQLVPTPKIAIVPQDGPLVLPQETFAAKKIATPHAGDVFDFGQVLTGWVKFTVKGNAGDKVVLAHAETLDAKGNFYTKNLRNAKQRIEYTLKGGGTETFEPRFTFQGFRYIQVEQWPGKPEATAFQARVFHSDMAPTLEFECSHPGLNQLHHNIEWGWKGNAVDVPTDCPQRDERLGWTGDAQIFAATAARLRQVDGFFRKWLRDVRADQHPDGSVPHVVPDVLIRNRKQEAMFKGPPAGSTGWGDIAVVGPWQVWLASGDQRLLEESWPLMRGWVEYMHAQAAGGVLWNTGFHFGDWVALDAKEGSYFGATPNDLTATAYYSYSTRLLAKAARVLGKEKEAKKYEALHARIVKAFQKEFLTPGGRLAARTQTAHILALVFGLIPEAHRARTIADLTKLLEENDGHLTTGFLGTPAFCDALASAGRLDLAYELLLKEDYPSWLYQVSKGATTVWEHWDGPKPDGTMWSTKMNSFNHYAYGAVGDWMYRTIGGIAPDPAAPGYKRIVFQPQPGGGLTHAKQKLETAYGPVSMEWTIAEGRWTMEFSVPPNASANLILPSGTKDYGSGTHRVEVAWS
jgi:alpha-L-rhamnosidase